MIMISILFMCYDRLYGHEKIQFIFLYNIFVLSNLALMAQSQRLCHFNSFLT